MKVLMLGWELPPRITGGLGTACQGLLEGLTAHGAEVLFLLPRAAGGEGARGSRILTTEDLLARGAAGGRSGAVLKEFLVDGPLSPYAAGCVTASRAEDDPASAYASSYDAVGRTACRYAHAAAELAEREAFDVIHAHDWMTWPAGLAARAVSGRPLVCHVHATEFDRSGARPDPLITAIERMGLSNADRVVCVSEYEAAVVEREYGPLARALRVVHNGVRAAGLDERITAPREGAATVLFLGRVTGQKDPATFLRAAARVAAARADVRFVLAGDGDLLGDMVALALELGLEERVRFTGFVEGDEVADLYRRAALFVLPSRSEPFGIAPLEAASHGVPVIVSEAAGVREALPCRTFPVGDDEALAAEILEVLGRPELARRMSEEGREAVRRATWERSAGDVLAVYREVAA